LYLGILQHQNKTIPCAHQFQ